MEYVTGKSPYRLPVINNYLIPVPPPTLQKGDRSVKAVRNGMSRRRFRPTTAPNGLEQLVSKVGYFSLLFCLCASILPSQLMYSELKGNSGVYESYIFYIGSSASYGSWK